MASGDTRERLAMAMRSDVERLFALEGAVAEKKQLLRIWVEKMKLAPEQREVVLTRQFPEPMMNKIVAGVRQVPCARPDALSGDQRPSIARSQEGVDSTILVSEHPLSSFHRF